MAALSKDLERLGLEANDVLMKSSSPSAQSISQIDNLLAQAAVSSDNSTSQRLKKFGNGKVVNQEVVSILGKLPDLSFMLNPILSFPVKYAGTDNEVMTDQNQPGESDSRNS